MLIAVLALQFVALLAIAVLFLRKTPLAQQDPALLGLPDQLARLVAEEGRRTREDNATAAAGLRNEVVGSISTLGEGLKSDLRNFREDNTVARHSGSAGTARSARRKSRSAARSSSATITISIGPLRARRLAGWAPGRITR